MKNTEDSKHVLMQKIAPSRFLSYTQHHDVTVDTILVETADSEATKTPSTTTANNIQAIATLKFHFPDYPAQ